MREPWKTNFFDFVNSFFLQKINQKRETEIPQGTHVASGRGVGRLRIAPNHVALCGMASGGMASRGGWLRAGWLRMRWLGVGRLRVGRFLIGFEGPEFCWFWIPGPSKSIENQSESIRIY